MSHRADGRRASGGRRAAGVSLPLRLLLFVAVLMVGTPLSVLGDMDAHRPVTYHFIVTNTTDKAQTVESVRTSCACLKVK